MKGSGNHIGFDGYGYDPRLARRWNIDPKTRSYPHRSPYLYAANNPILFIDADGEGDVYYIVTINQQTGENTFRKVDAGGTESDKVHYVVHLINKDGESAEAAVSSDKFSYVKNVLASKGKLVDKRGDKVPVSESELNAANIQFDIKNGMYIFGNGTGGDTNGSETAEEIDDSFDASGFKDALHELLSKLGKTNIFTDTRVTDITNKQQGDSIVVLVGDRDGNVWQQKGTVDSTKTTGKRSVPGKVDGEYKDNYLE